MGFFRRKKHPFLYPGQEIPLSTSFKRPLDRPTRQALETARNRLILTGLVFLFAFLTVAGRLISLSSHTSIIQNKNPLMAHRGSLHMKRADIVDRNGVVLATSLPTVSLYADPKFILDPIEATDKLLSVFPSLDRDGLLKNLSSSKRFVYLRRHLTPNEQYEVNRLGLPGIAFEKTERRVYPQAGLASHIVGMVDIDNNGISGLEREMNESLQNRKDPLTLSLDVGVQDAMHAELYKSIKGFDALGGAAILLQADTAEVRAMVSLPDYDPNRPGEADKNALFNRATLGVFEMGSIFKLFNAAMVLDKGLADLDDEFDATDPLKMAGFTISDYRGQKRPLNIEETLVYSSNIASAKMALLAGAEKQRNFLSSLGFLNRLPLELPERGSPLYPSRWRDINTATISYGYGLAATPLHAAAAAAPLVNGGLYYSPTLLKVTHPEDRIGTQVLSADTSATMRDLMRSVVTEGSGKNANVEGYNVGGKTGSAEKLKKNGYKERTLRTTFLSAFPMHKPEYVLLVMLDEPKATEKTYGFSTAGWNAVPTAGNIIATIAPLLGISPQRPLMPTAKPVHMVQAPLKENAHETD